MQVIVIAETLVKLEALAVTKLEVNDQTKLEKVRPLAKWTDLNKKVVLVAFLKAKNRALGRDKVTADLLRELELDIYKVTYFINKDLRKRKATLKETKLVFIPKQDRDINTVKGQRLITLLLVTGKGLERALVKWLGETRLKRGWFREN